MSKPRRAPMPCTSMFNGRVAVTEGSFWRSDPAAALRGFANGALPCSTRDAFRSAKASTGKKTSPRTSTSSGTSSPDRRCGMDEIVRTLWVMSSPTRPSPRVAARTSVPFS